MTRITEAIGKFLNNRVADSPFLLGKYTTDLETQLMVEQGEPGEDPGTYQEINEQGNLEVWSNKRWPHQAGSDPVFHDPPITFSPAARIERLGTTWWNYKTKRSVAVGIDIDVQEGHAASTTTNNAEEIEAVLDRLKNLDYVTVVRSTGGRGLHVYVFFDENDQPEARNHAEHTIVARKTLELISSDLNYDLKGHVDCVGSLFWIWAKKSPAGHDGFALVKEGTTLAGSRLDGVCLPVPTLKTNNANVSSVKLDDEHRRILEAIADQPYYYNMRADMTMVHTHTCAIRDAISNGLKVRGTFKTSSTGSDPSSANCFLVPLPGGVFKVFRFGQNRHEESWEFDGGKNFCFLNDAPSTAEVLKKLSSGRSKDRYKLSSEAVNQLAKQLGNSFDSPVGPGDYFGTVDSDGVITLSSKTPNQGWDMVDGISTFTLEPSVQMGDHRSRLLLQCDEFCRNVCHDGIDPCWMYKTQDDRWLVAKSFGDVACLVSERFGEFANLAKKIMTENPWNVVKIPFKEEYPGNRVWNYQAPTFRCEPATSGGDHPHFDMILNHVGQDLNGSVLESEWCRRAGIQTGADYLRAWQACLIHHPDQPLPYLFLEGPQNSGKSIFVESCSQFLFDGGVASASNALTGSFNGELEGAFLVYVEERDLNRKGYNAYEKIKEWTTGRTLTVRAIYRQQVTVPNYLHFVQMSNSYDHLPVEDGDTRIVALHVPKIDKMIPKMELEKALKEEAPRYLRTLLNTVVPAPPERLRIPALPTQTKKMMEAKAMEPWMKFLMEGTFECEGHKIEVGEFFKHLNQFCSASGLQTPDVFQIGHKLASRSDRVELGESRGKTYILNRTLDRQSTPRKKRLSTDNFGKIV